MKTIACVIGVVVGLGIAWGQTYRPQTAPVTYRPPVRQFAAGQTLGFPQSQILRSSDSEMFVVKFEDRLFTVSKYAHDIPYVMLGGRILSINGGMSAAP